MQLAPHPANAVESAPASCDWYEINRIASRHRSRPECPLAQPVSFDPTAVVDRLERTLLTVQVGQRSRDVVAECGSHRATPLNRSEFVRTRPLERAVVPEERYPRQGLYRPG